MTSVRHTMTTPATGDNSGPGSSPRHNEAPPEGGEGVQMTCLRCNTVNAAGAAFCSGCGNQLTVPGTYQSAARGAIVSQNLGLIGLVGLGLGFVGGVLVGAYILFPMGGMLALLGIAAPIIGMVVGYRVLMEMLAR